MQKLVVLFLALTSALALPAPEVRVDEDFGLNVIELIQKYGYPVEQYKYIETEDGYLLELHRIPHGKNNAEETNKPVVLLMHGILSSSFDWVVTGPEKGLAFLLADLGYDVWMGNARGNTWSRKHIEYNPNTDSKFWQFSWNEIALYDLPATIDYILEKTGEEKIFYIGHSQGTTSYYILMSEKPEYNDKIRLMVSLAPIAYMSHLASPFMQLLSQFESALEWLADFVGLDEFLPSNELTQLVGKVACDEQAQFPEICGNVLFILIGFDSEQLNRTMIPTLSQHTPAGSSTKQFLHYAQEIKSGKFRKYDFGLIQNLIKYGSVNPPDYHLDKVSSNVALFYSQNDWMSSITDVEQLYRELPNVVYKYLIPYEKFNHLDYMYAIDIVNLVYQRAIDLMANY